MAKRPDNHEWEDPTADEVLSLISVEGSLRAGHEPQAKALKALDPAKVARINAPTVAILAWAMMRRAIARGLHSDDIAEMALGQRAARDAQDRIYGKPVQPMAGSDGGPVEIRILYEGMDDPGGKE